MFFSCQVFDYHISAPLHMIFRSGSLLANMCVGAVLIGRKYSWQQVCAVLLVTLGIAIATTSSSKPESQVSVGRNLQEMNDVFVV